MMAPKLRLSCGLKAKRPAPSLLVFPLRCCSSKFLQAHRLNTRSNDGEGEDFFTFEGLSSVWLLFYQRLTQRFCFEVLLTAESQCFTHNDSCTIVPTTPQRRRAFKESWNFEVFFHSNSASSVVIFFHLAPPSPVSSPSQSPPSFPLPSFSTRGNQVSLSSIAVTTKAIKRTARTSLCRIWEHPQRCFPPFGQRPSEA